MKEIEGPQFLQLVVAFFCLRQLALTQRQKQVRIVWSPGGKDR